MSDDTDTLLLFAVAGALAFVYFTQRGAAAAGGLAPSSSPSPSVTGYTGYSPAPNPTSSPAWSPGGAAAASPVNVSPQGRAFIEGQEALRLTAYPDAGGMAIGYGHRLQPGESYPGGITQAQADQLFAGDLAQVENTINATVTAPLTQEQYDALASLIYNIGAGAWSSSTLLSDLNAGDYSAAAAQFPAWKYSGGVVSPVLVARRSQEAAMFASGAAYG